MSHYVQPEDDTLLSTLPQPFGELFQWRKMTCKKVEMHPNDTQKWKKKEKKKKGNKYINKTGPLPHVFPDSLYPFSCLPNVK